MIGATFARLARKGDRLLSDLEELAVYAISRPGDRLALGLFSDYLQENGGDEAAQAWGQQIQGFSDNRDHDAPEELVNLIDATPHMATSYNSWGADQLLELSSKNLPSVAGHPRLPTYTRDGDGGWSKTVYGAGGRSYSRRGRRVPIEIPDMVRELHDAGGPSNVAHAVLGAHYFHPTWDQKEGGAE